VDCGKLWNEVNYLHRQQYSDYLKLDWNPQAYKRYVPLVGSAAVQQIVRKNNEATRSFLALKRMAGVSSMRKHESPDFSRGENQRRYNGATAHLVSKTVQ